MKKKIYKFLKGTTIYPGLLTLSFKYEVPNFKYEVPHFNTFAERGMGAQWPKSFNETNTTGNKVISTGVGAATDYLSDLAANKIFGDSELGRGMGTLFSSGISSAGNAMADNILKGQVFSQGVGQEALSSIGGTAAGLASNYIGRGISSIGGNSALSRGIGAGVSTGLGTVGGVALNNLTKTGSLGKIFGTGAGAVNPYALGAQVLGSALGAATGPSKEYAGKHGNITRTADMVYDTAATLVNFIPGWGLLASGLMVLNKGLSNVFGSTDGMTTQDAILGSAFMPAPVKWLNMAGANTTNSFTNQSWQNSERINTFMGNAFGNLNDKFDTAREEAGKTYGTFSQGAYADALNNIAFANDAWRKLLNMTDLNEWLNVRSQYMTSINNQRYALLIQGLTGNRMLVGKQGIKILNNATNHNMGMRLLSAAALIDNKQMILSAQGGTKLYKPNIFKVTDGTGATRYIYRETPDSEEITVRPLNTIFSNPAEWTFTDDNGKYYTPRRTTSTNTAELNPDNRTGFERFLNNYIGEATNTIPKGYHTLPAIAAGAFGLASPALGEAALTSAFAGHGLSKAVNGEIDGPIDGALTALELAPLGRLVKPVYKGVVQPGMRLFNSPLTGNWTKIGNREYRFKPRYAAMNGVPIESRPIKTIRLYRATGTNGKFDASLDGGLEFAGQWFTNNLTKPQYYASVTVKRAKRAGVKNPIELLYVNIPESELNKYKASEILKGRTDIEYEPTEDFLIPLDYPRLRVPLEGYTGNLLLDARRPLPELPVESKPLQITAENAASITPEQWTAAQDAAIARGDMAEAQRLRDLHFKVSAPNTEITDIQYHGSPYTFNVFDPVKRGNRDQGWFGKGYYFTPSKDYAAMYGETRPFYINAEDVYTKGVGNIWFGRESSPKAKLWLKMQDKRGKGPEAETVLDDLRFSDAVRDAMPQTKPYNGIFEEVVTRNNNQMKLADAVTYGDDGVRVPLGLRDNFNINDIRYYESPNKKAMKGVKYIEQPPSATSLDAEQQLVQRLESYTPKVGENGLIEYKPLNSGDVINIPEEAIEKQIQRYVDSGITREDAIEYLREQFGYGAMTQNGKTFLLPEKYMITNPEYMKAHDAIHRVLRFDDSFNIPGAEGLNPNEAIAMISGEIKPALGIQANEPLTEEMLNKWLTTTNNKITGRYGFSSKIKDKKKFLEWVNKVAPVMLPLLLGGTAAATLYNTNK